MVVRVDDLEGTLGRAHELGATVHGREVFSIDGACQVDGIFELTWLTDPAGNRIALAGAPAG